MEPIEYFDETGEILISRYPPEGSGAFRIGTQLVVHENQIAYFSRDGQILDGFEAGRYSLTTRNLPLMSRLIGSFGRSPFRSNVYFVALKTFINLGWGTASPVTFRDSEFRMVAVRAHGAFSIRISKPRVFMQTIVGTKGLEYTHAIEEYLRKMIVSRFNEVLGQKLTSILDLPARYNEISLGVRDAVKDEFDQYGIQLVDLIIEAVTPPSGVQEMINRATGIEAQDISKYSAVAQADALRDAAKNPSGGVGDGLGAGLGLAMGMSMAHNIQMQQHEITNNDKKNSQVGGADNNKDIIKAKLRELKELLDEDLISQSDFDEQKKRLLEKI